MYNSRDGLKAGKNKNIFFITFNDGSRGGTGIFYVIVLMGERIRDEEEKDDRKGKKERLKIEGHLKRGDKFLENERERSL